MRFRLPLLAVAAVAAAGCGGGGGGGAKGSASQPAGASLVSADVPVFIAATTDDSSDQWKKADALLKKFPGREQLLASIKRELAQEGVDFERDVRPALGPEVDLAIFDLQDAGNSVVGMTKPDDPDKLVDLLHKGNDAPKVIKKRDDGWVVFSDSQTAVDQIGAEGDKLADDAGYKDALAKLPEESLATAWVDGPSAVNALKQQAGGSDLGAFGKLDWAAAALEARDDGAAVEIVTKGFDTNAEAFESSLLDKVPSDTLLFLAFKGLDKSLANIDRQAGQAGAFVESFLGVKLSDLVALFSGESTLYAGAGTPLPEVTLVLDGANADAKLATIAKLAAKAVSSFGGRGPTPTTVDGASFNELRFGPFAVLYGKADGRILITDTRNAVRDLRGGGGGSLADNDAFKSAKDAAGLPDENNGFLYVNLKDAIAEFSGLASESIPPDVASNLRPLRSLILYSTQDGDVGDTTIFVEIK